MFFRVWLVNHSSLQPDARTLDRRAQRHHLRPAAGRPAQGEVRPVGLARLRFQVGHLFAGGAGLAITTLGTLPISGMWVKPSTGPQGRSENSESYNIDSCLHKEC